MTQDNIYQVVYEYSICGNKKQIDDTSLKAISQEFEKLGWGNVPTYRPGGKTEYVVYCPRCYAGLYEIDTDTLREEAEAIDWEDDMHKEWMDEQDNWDLERPGLFR